MLFITAVLRAKPGEEAKLLAALLDVAVHVRADEPGTLGFHVSSDLEDPTVFTTYERFANRAAMDTHNGSDAVARFFHAARPTLDGPVTLHVRVGGAAIVEMQVHAEAGDEAGRRAGWCGCIGHRSAPWLECSASSWMATTTSPS